jgi:DNA invertase Pin-like site-specific DNA recombinase
LSIFAGLAQREREIISIRTKLALQAKKERGEAMGTIKNLHHVGRIKGVATNQAKAKNNPNNVRAKSMIAKCKEQGMTLQAIAQELNSSGFVTSQGKEFTKMTVKRLV